MKLLIQNLEKKYNSKKVVDNVSIEVNEGEIVGLLGPNGAGKTTTFYMILGLLNPDAGKIFLGENEITKIPMFIRARMGLKYLPQEPSVFKKLTVEENLIIGLEASDIDNKEKILDELLEQFDLKHLKKQKCYLLSGGEKRKVEIARALIKKPYFLLLDEPFIGIDPITVEELHKIIFDLKKMGVGILLTDHNVYETLPIIDKGYIIYEGKIFKEGDAKSLIEDTEVRKVYLGEKFRLTHF